MISLPRLSQTSPTPAKPATEPPTPKPAAAAPVRSQVPQEQQGYQAEPAAKFAGESVPQASARPVLDLDLYQDDKGLLQSNVFEAKLEAGEQTQISGGLIKARIGDQKPGAASLSAELMTVRAGYGTRNEDGSKGFNAGVVLRAAGVESTISTGASGLTVGVGPGIGLAASVGVRDADKDGYAEACLGLDIGVLKIGGVQLEDPRGWGLVKALGKVLG